VELKDEQKTDRGRSLKFYDIKKRDWMRTKIEEDENHLVKIYKEEETNIGSSSVS
jgi:hypothetical protein